MWSTVAIVRSGNRTFQPARPQHVERLRRRDLVDEVQADEQLRLPVRQLPHRVRVPDLLEQRRGHWYQSRWYRTFWTPGSGFGLAVIRDSGFGVRDSEQLVLAELRAGRCHCGSATCRSIGAQNTATPSLATDGAETAERQWTEFKSFRDLDAWNARWIWWSTTYELARDSFPERALRTGGADAPRCRVDSFEHRGRSCGRARAALPNHVRIALGSLAELDTQLSSQQTRVPVIEDVAGRAATDPHRPVAPRLDSLISGAGIAVEG